jgi:hypothetical protein
MRSSIRIAALLLSGVLFIGCDNKDNTAVAPPAQTSTPPALPTSGQMSDAAKNMADNAKTTAKNATDAASVQAQKAKDAVSSEANKMLPTTMPTVPGMSK